MIRLAGINAFPARGVDHGGGYGGQGGGRGDGDGSGGNNGRGGNSMGGGTSAGRGPDGKSGSGGPSSGKGGGDGRGGMSSVGSKKSNAQLGREALGITSKQDNMSRVANDLGFGGGWRGTLGWGGDVNMSSLDGARVGFNRNTPAAIGALGGFTPGTGTFSNRLAGTTAAQQAGWSANQVNEMAGLTRDSMPSGFGTAGGMLGGLLGPAGALAGSTLGSIADAARAKAAISAAGLDSSLAGKYASATVGANAFGRMAGTVAAPMGAQLGYGLTNSLEGALIGSKVPGLAMGKLTGMAADTPLGQIGQSSGLLGAGGNGGLLAQNKPVGMLESAYDPVATAKQQEQMRQIANEFRTVDSGWQPQGLDTLYRG